MGSIFFFLDIQKRKIISKMKLALFSTLLPSPRKFLKKLQPPSKESKSESERRTPIKTRTTTQRRPQLLLMSTLTPAKRATTITGGITTPTKLLKLLKCHHGSIPTKLHKSLHGLTKTKLHRSPPGSTPTKHLKFHRT